MVGFLLVARKATESSDGMSCVILKNDVSCTYVPFKMQTKRKKRKGGKRIAEREVLVHEHNGIINDIRRHADLQIRPSYQHPYWLVYTFLGLLCGKYTM